MGYPWAGKEIENPTQTHAWRGLAVSRPDAVTVTKPEWPPVDCLKARLDWKLWTYVQSGVHVHSRKTVVLSLLFWVMGPKPKAFPPQLPNDGPTSPDSKPAWTVGRGSPHRPENTLPRIPRLAALNALLNFSLFQFSHNRSFDPQ
jgi:hypothetical protein